MLSAHFDEGERKWGGFEHSTRLDATTSRWREGEREKNEFMHVRKSLLFFHLKLQQMF